ncbi:MAG: hypothetical protein JWO15_420 [Sphingomonadales bacterium]|nr:hypothetical protein [Sphingomonadales bacterium]
MESADDLGETSCENSHGHHSFRPVQQQEVSEDCPTLDLSG